MHDISIAQAFMDAVLEQLNGRKPKQIELKLAVGELRFVEAEHLKHLLKEMLRMEFGNKMKIKMGVQIIKPEIECKCGFSGAIGKLDTTHEMAHLGIFEAHCPKCRGNEFEIVKGRECLLLGIKARE